MLDAWDEQLISADEIRAWAERELLGIADPRSIPAWLLDLVQQGPGCLADASHSWRRRADFKVRFALHATRVNAVINVNHSDKKDGISGDRRHRVVRLPTPSRTRRASAWARRRPALTQLLFGPGVAFVGSTRPFSAAHPPRCGPATG